MARILYRISGAALLAGCLAACVLLKYPSAFGLEAYEITSGSMAPVYPIGCTVYVRTGRMPSVGDAAAFYDGSGDVVVHRAVAILDGTAVTKGDANRERDPDPVPYENIIGTAAFSLPRLGGTSGWLATAALCAGACLGLSLLAMGAWAGKPAGYNHERTEAA